MNKRPKHSKKRIIAAIKGSGGIKLEIARRLKCSRTTVYEYIDSIPEVKKAYWEEKEGVGDICEAQIIKAMKQGSESMVRWYAGTQLQDRGYTETKKIDANFKGEVTNKYDLSNMSVEQLKALAGEDD